jgi:hypothetical protein
VKNRFQSLPFKCNLQCYNAARNAKSAADKKQAELEVVTKSAEVGLCTLNQVDP